MPYSVLSLLLYLFAAATCLCEYLVVGGQVSTGSRPGNLGRRISRGKAAEFQTLALLDVGYRRLDGDH